MFILFEARNRAGCFHSISKAIQKMSGLVELNIFMQYFTGVFIMVCFTTTKKVRGLLKDRLFKRWNGKGERQTSVTRDRQQRNSHIVTAPTGSKQF